jgi:hypothetical protein
MSARASQRKAAFKAELAKSMDHATQTKMPPKGTEVEFPRKDNYFRTK